MYASQINCPFGKFACLSNCITNDKVCDGVAHCSNGTDEKNCENWQFVDSMKKCGDNKQCISKESFYDLKKDCQDGSDQTCSGFHG